MGQTQMWTVANARDTDANWTSANPVIGPGVLIVVISTDPGVLSDQIKIGDGVSTYTALPILNAAGNGAYLGIATTGTTPPTLTENAYYFATANGTFTNFPTGSGPVVIASTNYLSVISYDESTTHWTATNILNTSSIPAATLAAVLTAGFTGTYPGSGRILLSDAAGGTINLQANPTANSISVSKGAKAANLLLGRAEIIGATNQGVIVESGQGTAQPSIIVTDFTSSFLNTIQGQSLVANIVNQMPTQPGELAANNGGIASVSVSSVTSFTITHGLPFTPRRIMITPEGTATFAAAWCTGGYVTGIGGTTFTINFPAAQTGLMKFFWQAF